MTENRDESDNAVHRSSKRVSFDGATNHPDDDVKPFIDDPALDHFLDDFIAESVPSSTRDPRNTFQKE